MMETIDEYAMVTQPMRHMNVKQVTAEIPPTFDGRASWFQYEEAIDEWCDVTKLEDVKRGPALRNQLEGQAALYKHLLDREKLKDPDTGVEYFKKVIREHFVKGANSVFLWRFLQIFRHHRGTMDMARWLTRMVVLKARVEGAWMDLNKDKDADSPEVQEFFRKRTNEINEANTIRIEANQISGQMGYTPEGHKIALLQVLTKRGIEVTRDTLEQHYAQEPLPLSAADLVDEYNRVKKEAHREKYPLSDNLMSLLLVVLADLSEQQRERLTSYWTLKDRKIQQLTYQEVNDMFRELCCNNKTGLDNPYMNTAPMSKAFICLEAGTMDDQPGHWAEDEQGDVGFLPDYEDKFYVFDDSQQCWLTRTFRSRVTRRGKGKGKGKGKKGRSRFRPYGKGKGKSAKGVSEAWTESDAWAAKGRKGKRKGKGKSKGYDKDPSSGKADLASPGQSDGQRAGAVPPLSTASSSQMPASDDNGAGSPEDTYVAGYESWDNEWYYDAGYQDYEGWPCYVEDVIGIRESALYMEQSFMTKQDMWECIDIKQKPTHVILDLGLHKGNGQPQIH